MQHCLLKIISTHPLATPHSPTHYFIFLAGSCLCHASDERLEHFDQLG